MFLFVFVFKQKKPKTRFAPLKLNKVSEIEFCYIELYFVWFRLICFAWWLSDRTHDNLAKPLGKNSIVNYRNQ